jgi:hypothetical protein
LIGRICDGLEELRKDQARFRQGRGTSDQIFILCNIIEQSVEWQAPLYLNVINFETAVDSIHRESLWKIMELYSIPSDLITTIKWLYQDEICVMNNGLQSDWVRIESGVKQGCGMSAVRLGEDRERGKTGLWNVRIRVSLGAGLGDEEQQTGEDSGIRWKFKIYTLLMILRSYSVSSKTSRTKQQL